MPLTDVAVRTAKPKPKPYKLSDERGLYVLVKSVAGRAAKYWRFDYRFAGKRKTAALGVYPDVNLKDAREQRDKARKLLTAGIDPGNAKQAGKKAAKEVAANSFEVVAREWFSKNKARWSEGHKKRALRLLEKDLFPWIGSRSIATLAAPELLTVLRRIEARNAIETAHRAMNAAGQIFRYAVATGRAERDPTGDLRGALARPQEKHHASITEPRAVGSLMRAIDGYQGQAVTQLALRLAPLVFVRPGELRRAEWSEFDVKKLHLNAPSEVEWRIPAERMKMREPHLVPLSAQAIRILRELHALTGGGKYLFPSVRNRDRPMSENTMNAALRRLGYGNDEMTSHGFRSMASTLLNEQGWNRDAIERQLAHAERDNVRSAYNFAEYLPVRRKMMQAWADYLGQLKLGAGASPLKAVAA
jgi:integrase